jgi:hypothetical protein
MHFSILTEFLLNINWVSFKYQLSFLSKCIYDQFYSHQFNIVYIMTLCYLNSAWTSWYVSLIYKVHAEFRVITWHVSLIYKVHAEFSVITWYVSLIYKVHAEFRVITWYVSLIYKVLAEFRVITWHVCLI